LSSRPEDRAELIDSILGAKTAWGGGVGVYGADVCALCGTVDTYRGWIMAAYGCHFGKHNEFVCSECRERLIPKGVTAMSERARRVRKALSESRLRYCRLCESRIKRAPRWGRRRSGKLPRVCDECRSELHYQGVADEEEIVEIVRERVRRRFLELLAPDELTDMAGVVDDMREELDSTDFAATQLGRE
jgi:hypothetical protein